MIELKTEKKCRERIRETNRKKKELKKLLGWHVYEIEELAIANLLEEVIKWKASEGK
jgi:hypothetical protein